MRSHRTILRNANIKKWPRRDCLGFAPRSESFAIEPMVQVCSISSLSGLTSCRPSANPLEHARTPPFSVLVVTIQKLKRIGINPILFNLRLARFERATLCLEGRCSIQLSYRRITRLIYRLSVLPIYSKNITSILKCKLITIPDA